MVDWYDDDDTPNEPIPTIPKRVVKVRTPPQKEEFKVSVEEYERLRGKVETLEMALDNADNTVQAQNTTILRLQRELYEASQNHPTDNSQAKIELAVLRRRIAGYKMTGKISILRDLDSIKELL